MGAESIAHADDSQVAQTRKPDKVEALDMSLLDMPVKEISDFANSISSPDSVLRGNLQENAGEASSELRAESFTFDTVNNVSGSDNVDTGISTPTGSAITKEADEDAGAEGKQNSSDVTSVAPQDALPPAAEVKEGTGEEDSIIKTDEAVESPIVIVQSPTAKESIAHEIQEMEEISLEEVSVKEKKPVEKGIAALVSQPVMSVSKLVESFNNIKKSAPVLEAAEGSSKQSTTVPKEEPRTEPKPADLKVVARNIKKDALSNKEAPVIKLKKITIESTAAKVQAKAEVSKAAEVQAKAEVSKTAEMQAKAEVPKAEEMQAKAEVPKAEEMQAKAEVPKAEEMQAKAEVPKAEVSKAEEMQAKVEVPKATEVQAKAEVSKAEGMQVKAEVPNEAEVQAKAEVPKAAERTEREEKLAVLAASAIEALPASKFARASEIQEASEPVSPPTQERSGAVIRLTRQMSRVSTGMGPMSPRFEMRAAREIQDLQEKVKVMEEDLRRKAAVIETQSFNHKERETELLYKVECLELANEQLLQGGDDSSIQLQMELTRLQRQNSVLQLRERELQFQINTQEMIKTQMLDKRPPHTEPVNPVKQLESKVAILESKLAEAVEVSNMYKIQLHEAFTRQKSMQSASLLNLGDGEDVLKELQKLRKQTKEQETELVDLQDRFFITSVHLAESAAQKEELLSKLKRLQGGK